MRSLELDEMEVLHGGFNCTEEVIHSGIKGAVAGAITGALAGGVGALPGLAGGWLVGSVSGGVACMVTQFFWDTED